MSSTTDNRSPSTNLPETEFWAHTKSATFKLKFNWTIDNFSFYLEDDPVKFTAIKSPEYSAPGHEDVRFYLSLYPNNQKIEDKDHLALFLYCTSPSYPVYAKYEMSIVDREGRDRQSINYQDKFIINDEGYGCLELVPRSVLLDPANGLLPGDQLTIRCVAIICFKLDDSSAISEMITTQPLGVNSREYKDELSSLVASIMQFLTDQLSDTSLSDDAKESIEVSIECLGAAFNINPVDGSLPAKKPLLEIYTSYLENNKEEESTMRVISEQDKAKADALKNEGNELMKNGKFQEALESYTKAIEIDGTNPIYYCNRAAAHTKLGNYQATLDDGNIAIKHDPNYSKAYCRMGLAYVNLNDHQRARDCYKKAVELVPSESNIKNLQLAEQKLQEQQAQFNSGFNFGNILSNPNLVNFATQMMFGHESTKGAQEGKVEIDIDVFKDTFKDLQQYICKYINTRKIPAKERLTTELLTAASDTSKVKSLNPAYEKHLSTSLSIETAATTLLYADLHNATSLKINCLKYIADNIFAVMSTDAWINMTQIRPELMREISHFSSKQTGSKRARESN